MPGRQKHRSGCPVAVSLEIFGDRWSLLVVRDLMVRGFRTFKDFQNSGEGIATNILSDRLRRLESAGVISAEGEEGDARRVNYRLTRKGIDLAPLLLEVLIWGATHENDGKARPVAKVMSQKRELILAEVRRRWKERDHTPLQLRTGEWNLPK